MTYSVRVILCKNQEQLKFYFTDMLHRIKQSGRDFVKIDSKTIIDGEDKFIFLTPDDANRIQGLRIHGWDEVGSVYEHSNYNDAVELLEQRMI